MEAFDLSDRPVETTTPQSGKPAPAASDGGGGGGRIIALMNQKGGVGKTTTTVNVGAALHRAGKRVLMIDLDPQAHLSLHLGVEPDALELSVYDLMTDDAVAAAEVVQQVDEGMGLLPAEVNLAGIEGELADRAAEGVAQRVLAAKTRELVGQFDYVLLDCPPSLGLLTVNGLALAREVIVPMQAHFLALQGLSKLLETVRLVRDGINPALTVAGVVLCMHEGQTVLAGEVKRDLTEFFDAHREQDVPWRDAVVYEPAVRRNIKLAESPSFGQSIFAYAAESNGARDYEALAKSIASTATPIPNPNPGS